MALRATDSGIVVNSRAKAGRTSINLRTQACVAHVLSSLPISACEWVRSISQGCSWNRFLLRCRLLMLIPPWNGEFRVDGCIGGTGNSHATFHRGGFNHVFPSLTSALAHRTGLAGSAVVRRVPWSLSNRKRDAHFRPRTRPAAYAKSRTDVFGTVAHSAQTPVRTPYFLNHLGVDSTAVVTHE